MVEGLYKGTGDQGLGTRKKESRQGLPIGSDETGKFCGSVDLQFFASKRLLYCRMNPFRDAIIES
jgi:hypothetical protein